MIRITVRRGESLRTTVSNGVERRPALPDPNPTSRAMPDPTSLADLAETLRWRQVDGGASAYPRLSVDLMRRSEFTLRANCRLVRRSKIHSLYHFVSDCKHARGNDYPKRLGGFDVDD